MRIYTNLFPQGKKAALTMSYDDGTVYDRRLVEMFDKHHIRGTFHLNAARLNTPGYVTAEEIGTLYKNHEVSCHTYTHPFPIVTPDTTMVQEIMEDRRRLEQACGYTVRGMSYPYGDYSARAIKIFTSCGMQYSRTTVSTNDFKLPEDFMQWHPTCHHREDIKGLFDKLIANTKRFLRHNVMYVWGHSYEFHNDGNWDKMEDFCSAAKDREELWYATNIELFDYIIASRNLMVSVEGGTVYNPSNRSVWVSADGEPAEIKPGENRL